MPTEVEAKFMAAPGALLSLRAASALGDATLGPVRSVEETDRYLDTPDGRLAAVRWACRLRHRDGHWTVSLKGPPRDGPPGPGWLHARPELEGPATAAAEPRRWPASPARERVVELSGGEQLVERVRLVQRRAERAVDLDGARLGTLSLDEVTVEGPSGTLGSFDAVELELDRGRPDADLRAAAQALAALPGLRTDRLSKLEHALALLEG